MKSNAIITAAVPASLAEAIEQRAQEEERTRSSIIRRALTQQLVDEQPEPVA